MEGSISGKSTYEKKEDDHMEMKTCKCTALKSSH